MRKSIRIKLTALLVLIMFLTIFSGWLILHFVIKGYFIENTKTNLVKTYLEINKVFTQYSDDEVQLKEQFGIVSGKSDSIILVVHNGQTAYTNTDEKSKMIDSLVTITTLLSDVEEPEDRPGEFHFNINDDFNFSTSLGANSYVIQQNHDNRFDSDYYDLAGVLSNGDLIAVRTSVSTINEGVDLATKAFGLVGIFVTLTSSILMFIVSSKFSKPIVNMSQIAKKMTNLDFDAKVDVKGKDEVSVLGESMNELSSKLESTISELKTANNELRKDLENKVAIDEMRKEFLSHVSHELKTPIALIQGYAEGLNENVTDDLESRQFYCDVIIDEANKMNNMVKKLLTLNEIEFGTANVDFTRFDVYELITNIIASSKILMEQDNIKINLVMDSPLYVWADEYMIEDVISNYLSNAIHYTGKDGYIEITTIQHEKDVRIKVYNKGPHIPEDELEKVFVKFYKVDKARTREYGGSGIGLSIVAATMNAHGKSYGAYNERDGVTFYCDLDTCSEA